MLIGLLLAAPLGWLVIAYLGSLGYAALATVLCLLIGYPFAYTIARARGSCCK